MKRFIGYGAVVGFVLSLILHFGSYFGLRVGTGLLFLMHTGAIAPLFIIRDELGKKRNVKTFWMNPVAPDWINFAIKLFFIYAVINFLVMAVGLFSNLPEHHQRLRGEYILLESGPPRTFLRPDASITDRPIVNLTGIPAKRVYHNGFTLYEEIPESEFTPVPPILLRGFSGHWMIFYLAILSKCLYPTAKRKNDDLLVAT